MNVDFDRDSQGPTGLKTQYSILNTQDSIPNRQYSILNTQTQDSRIDSRLDSRLTLIVMRIAVHKYGTHSVQPKLTFRSIVNNTQMPVELILSPVMRPAVMAKAIVFHPHRPASRYIPNIIDLDGDQVHSYTIRREFGTGDKAFGVFDDTDPSTRLDRRLYRMVRSRAVKGAYKFYTEGIENPTAAMRAGLRSNVLLMRQADGDNFELGWHVVSHKVDAIDSYRLFQLADGSLYQWTTQGKFLERVRNVGEKDSEVRERVAQVIINGDKGFTIKVDESKVTREMAITTAMISYIDQWNTELGGVGGIYYPYKHFQTRWKRD